MSTRSDIGGSAASTESVSRDQMELTYREAIRAALEDAMAADPRVLLLGEDVAEPGGVFKTTEGLFAKFGPSRVIDTPICENGFMGVALGMAVTGLRPVVEIMFSDFLPTAGDAIVNEVPKFRFMSGGQCRVPLTVRAIGGAGGRFGTQHSATGESWFLHVAGLRIAAAGSPNSAYQLLRTAIALDDPVLFFEHKGMYTRKGLVQRGDVDSVAIQGAQVVRAGGDVTVVATLLMVEKSLAAAEVLAKEGIEAEVIDLRWLKPIDLESIRRSLERTGRILIVEEQGHTGGWGASVISELTMGGFQWRSTPAAVSMPADLPIPFSPPLEDIVLPSVDRIASAIRQTVTADRPEGLRAQSGATAPRLGP